MKFYGNEQKNHTFTHHSTIYSHWKQHWKQNVSGTLKWPTCRIHVHYLSDDQTNCRMYKCEWAAPTIRLSLSRFLELHQDAVTVFRVEKHHWLPMSAYSGLCWQSSDVLRFQVGYGGIDVVYLQPRRKNLCQAWWTEQDRLHSVSLMSPTEVQSKEHHAIHVTFDYRLYISQILIIQAISNQGIGFSSVMTIHCITYSSCGESSWFLSGEKLLCDTSWHNKILRKN